MGEVATLNIGVDMAFFGHKLSGSAEFYNKYSYDVLANTTVPVISQGVESMLLQRRDREPGRGVFNRFRLACRGDLSWSGVLNYSYNHNELKKIRL